MRRTLQNAPQSTIFLVFLLLMPSLGVGAGLPTAAAGRSVAPEICFPLPDGERMLRDLESLPPCREAVKAAEEVINSNRIKDKALEDRIAEQDREIAAGKKTIEDTRKAGEEAAKVAGGAWYRKVLSVAKWGALFFLGGLVVGGMAK